VNAVARVVEQHRDVGVVLGCEVEAERDMLPRVVVSELDPWNAPDDVGAERHGLFHQAVGARLFDDAVLRESHHLNVDDAAKLLAHGDQRLDAFEAGLAVDVRERADVENAVQRRQRRGAAGVRRDPGGVVFRLDRARQIDGAERLAHVRSMVGGERSLVHHRQRPHLAQMQVGIDERFGDQTPSASILSRADAPTPSPMATIRPSVMAMSTSFSPPRRRRALQMRRSSVSGRPPGSAGVAVAV
jgi:hypothetical protein